MTAHTVLDDGLIIHDELESDATRALIQEHFGEREFGVVSGDPPYGQIVKKPWDLISEDRVVDIYNCATSLALSEWMAPGAALALWWGIGVPGCRPGYQFAASAEREHDIEQLEHVTWRKRRGYGTNTKLLFTREELSIYRSRSEKHTFNKPYLEQERGYAGFNADYPALDKRYRRTNVWDDITELFRDKTHVCEKPEALYRVIYETWNGPDLPVLDLFSGSGAAGSAARALGLRFCLVDSEQASYETAVRRLGAKI